MQTGRGGHARDDPADTADAFEALCGALYVEAGFERVVMERPPEGEAWLALRDRLRRASTEERR